MPISSQYTAQVGLTLYIYLVITVVFISLTVTLLLKMAQVFLAVGLPLHGTYSLPFLFSGIVRPSFVILNPAALSGMRVSVRSSLGCVGVVEPYAGFVCPAGAGLTGSAAQLILDKASSDATATIFGKCINFMLTPRWFFELRIRLAWHYIN